MNSSSILFLVYPEIDSKSWYLMPRSLNWPFNNLISSLPLFSNRSFLLTTIQFFFSMSSLSNSKSSLVRILNWSSNSISGFSGSKKIIRLLVLEICFKNLIPRPKPVEAPSIKPGISAITYDLSKYLIVPRFGLRVVNG